MQYFQESIEDGVGRNPCLVVVAPFVLQGDAVVTSFYRAFHRLNPLAPYVLLWSSSELLSTFYFGASASCLVIIVGDCSICFSVVVNSRDDEVVQVRPF